MLYLKSMNLINMCTADIADGSKDFYLLSKIKNLGKFPSFFIYIGKTELNCNCEYDI